MPRFFKCQPSEEPCSQSEQFHSSKKFVQAVLHLNPTAFVMENVSMLKSNIHQFYLDKSDSDVISRFGIKTTDAVIPLLDAEYWFDSADVIVSNAQDIQNNLWDENDYLVLNVI